MRCYDVWGEARNKRMIWKIADCIKGLREKPGQVRGLDGFIPKRGKHYSGYKGIWVRGYNLAKKGLPPEPMGFEVTETPAVLLGRISHWFTHGFCTGAGLPPDHPQWKCRLVPPEYGRAKTYE